MSEDNITYGFQEIHYTCVSVTDIICAMIESYKTIF